MILNSEREASNIASEEYVWGRPYLHHYLGDQGWYIDTDAPANPEKIPLLRWIRDGKYVDLYYTGMEVTGTSADLEKALGIIETSLKKGPMQLGKRLSRFLRAGRFEWTAFERPRIKLVPNDKEWDGAGVVWAGYLKKFNLHKETRVEFTVQGPEGQYKGHAIRKGGKDPGWDLMIPDDPKTEVKTAEWFVMFNPVHGTTGIHLDFQSNVNLHSVFPVEYLTSQLQLWAATEAEKCFQGQANAGRADEDHPWFFPAYVDAGHDVRCFPSTVRAMWKTPIDQLNSMHERFSFPVEGYRVYIMPDCVGREAGIKKKQIGAGYAEVDVQNATLWVSTHDFPAIAAATGGADMDDAYWVIAVKIAGNPEFEEGEDYLLFWRSPNQPGEFWIAKNKNPELVPSTRTLSWNDIPKKLSERNNKYLYEEPAPRFCSSDPYSFRAMQDAKALIDSAGVLGGLCNFYMAAEAMNCMPTVLPMPLEAVIDCSVKTGGNLSQVANWLKKAASDMASNTVVPPVLSKRLGGRAQTNDEVEFHWLNYLDWNFRLVKQWMNDMQEKMTYEAAPPMELLDEAQKYRDLPEVVEILQEWTNAMRKEEQNAFIQANETIGSMIEAMDPELRRKVILGLIYTSFVSENHRAGYYIWLETVYKHTLQVLAPYKIEFNARRGAMSLVWFNLAKKNKKIEAELPSQVDKELVPSLKEASDKAAAKFKGKARIMYLPEIKRLGIGQKGKLLGMLPKNYPTDECDIIVHKTYAKDGEWRILWSYDETAP